MAMPTDSSSQLDDGLLFVSTLYNPSWVAFYEPPSSPRMIEELSKADLVLVVACRTLGRLIFCKVPMVRMCEAESASSIESLVSRSCRFWNKFLAHIPMTHLRPLEAVLFFFSPRGPKSHVICVRWCLLTNRHLNTEVSFPSCHELVAYTSFCVPQYAGNDVCLNKSNSHL